MENFFAEVGQELTDEQLNQVTGGAGSIFDVASAAFANVPAGPARDQVTKVTGIIGGAGVGGSSLSFSTLFSSLPSAGTTTPGVPSISSLPLGSLLGGV
jgi:bacteriocin-like protein